MQSRLWAISLAGSVVSRSTMPILVCALVAHLSSRIQGVCFRDPVNHLGEIPLKSYVSRCLEEASRGLISVLSGPFELRLANS